MVEKLNPLFTMQHRGNPSQLLAAKVRQISRAQTYKKSENMLGIPQTSFARELRSKVVYKLTCSGCSSTYFGQTIRHLATRVDEHRIGDSLEGATLVRM